MLTNKLASDILSQEDDIECTNDTSEMRKSTFTKANILAPPLERFKAKLNNRSRTSTHITALHAVQVGTPHTIWSDVQFRVGTPHTNFKH